jgi:hypothetical protein
VRSAVVVRQLVAAARHHNESDGSEQAREPANNDDDKHKSPNDGMFGFHRTIRELGLLPYTERYGVQNVSVNRGTYPQCEGLAR